METSPVEHQLRNKIVHLDLKGAPPKLLYMEKLLYLIKEWGGTGILLEWEDTFPYQTDLVEVGSLSSAQGDGLYTPEDVQNIFKMAKNLELEAIQLVQTIGHMEFVLKHPKFQHLRELQNSPAVLCPSNSESVQLVLNMLDQTLAAQPDAKYFHIGADEVWHLCFCKLCKKRATFHEDGLLSLYFGHIKRLAMYLREKRPDIKILMWDDMLRKTQSGVFKEYNLDNLIVPVVWTYSDERSFYIPPEVWDRYHEVFPEVWTGSAFKGAACSQQMLVPMARYVNNQEAWMREMTRFSSKINFNGIILTGWSRFDHFATMCELLPLALPSLKMCLKRVNNETENLSTDDESFPPEEWPGCQLSACIKKFAELKDRCMLYLHGGLWNHNVLTGGSEAARAGEVVGHSYVTTWMNPWQLRNHYTNAMQLEEVAKIAERLIVELISTEQDLLTNLDAIFGPRSVKEWIGTNVQPVLDQVIKVLEEAKRCANSPSGIHPTDLNDACDV